MIHRIDKLVFGPADVDLSRSPLAGSLDAETYVLGAFNPGLARLPNGNLLLMVRVAESLLHPIRDGHVHAIRWTGEADRPYTLDAWPLDAVDIADPRKFLLRSGGWRTMALTSLSWLLPVELSSDGLELVATHYDKVIAPAGNYQCYGIEDARISHVGGRYLMTSCSVSPERHSTTLYSSEDGIDWRFEGIVLDHQNKDMLIFEGLIGGKYWAQTRPLGDLYFAYPPGSPWRAGPSINLATSPDALHWKPHIEPGIRPHAAAVATVRIGGGSPPILTDEGWLTLWHGVEPKEIVGIYRTYWSILDRDDPAKVLRSTIEPLLAPGDEDREGYVPNVVYTCGALKHGDMLFIPYGVADSSVAFAFVSIDNLLAAMV